ncbi:hypothetical protein B0H11DRAFT_1983678 [Mycena galericulata]|nr:hypothetical protein B0H11DRAFT_1983678 [Mycena galericulata]
MFQKTETRPHQQYCASSKCGFTLVRMLLGALVSLFTRICQVYGSFESAKVCAPLRFPVSCAYPFFRAPVCRVYHPLQTVDNYKCQCTLHPKSMPNTTSPPPSSIVRLHVLEILLRQSSRLRNASGMKGRGCGGRLERSATRLARRGAEGAGQPERSSGAAGWGSARRAADGGEQEQRSEVEVSRGSTIPHCACRYFPIYQVFLLPLLLPEAS